MTKEQAEKEIRDNFTEVWANGIIEALEQESTTKNALVVDCVNRAEVKKIAKEMYLEVANMKLDVNTISDCISYTSSKCREVLESKLQALSSVTPIRPKGHWCILKDEYGDIVDAICSNCDAHGHHKWNYCPNCGVSMEGNKE